MQEINDVASAAVGGINVTSTAEGLERYPINLRFAREVSDDLDKLRETPVILADEVYESLLTIEL